MNTWLSILPPLVAIALALFFKEVISSLLAGILVGLFILNGFTIEVIPQFLDKYLITTVTDKDHQYVILFTLLIGATVALIRKGNGLNTFVTRLGSNIKSKRGAELTTYFLGCIIFFDDYANTLIVGNSAQALTDKYKVSREKLAYIVDSTSAPIASIAFVSTWIGAEVGYIQSATNDLVELSPYLIFLHSLKYSLYPILTLAFVFMLIWFKKDYGAMKHIQTLKSQESTNVKQAPIYKAVLPIVSLIVITLVGLYITGNSKKDTSITAIIGNANSYKALLWASFISCIIAFITNWKGLNKTVETAISGIKNMMHPAIILILAWVLSSVITDLQTASFLKQMIGDAIPYYLFGASIFVLAFLVSFSTGSSWGTMAILYPLVLPIAIGLDNNAHELLFHVTAAVLGGAVFGDHCSPISDTTILSSMATECNHINHVKTQLPYTLTVGAVCVVVSIFIGLGLPWYLGMGAGIISLWGILKMIKE